MRVGRVLVVAVLLTVPAFPVGLSGHAAGQQDASDERLPLVPHPPTEVREVLEGTALPPEAPQPIMPPSSPAKVVPLGACTPACAPMVVVENADGPGAEAPNVDLYGDDLRLPQSVGDRDGDGVEDLLLIEPSSFWEAEIASTNVTTVDGATGEQGRTYTLEAAWIFPYETVPSAAGPLDVFFVVSGVHSWDQGTSTWYLFEGQTIAFDVATGAEAWSMEWTLDVEEDGSGSISSSALLWPGQYLETGGQAILLESTTEWEEHPSNDTLRSKSTSLVDTRTLAVHWRIQDPTFFPRTTLGEPGDLDVAALEPGPNGTTNISYIDGATGVTQWTLGAETIGFEPDWTSTAMRDGEEILVAFHTPYGGEHRFAAISTDGVVHWDAVFPGPVYFLHDLGVDEATKTSVFATVDGPILGWGGSFETELITLDLLDGSVRWASTIHADAEEADHTSARLDWGRGDLTGDGLSEIALTVTRSPAPPDGANELIVHSSEDGEELGRTHIPGRLVSFGDQVHPAGSSVEALPALVSRTSTTAAPFLGPSTISEGLYLVTYDPSSDSYEEALVDERTRLPSFHSSATIWYGMSVLAPRGDGQVQDVLAYWARSDTANEGTLDLGERSRYGTWLHELPSGDQRWAIESEAPWDVQAWEALDTA